MTEKQEKYISLLSEKLNWPEWKLEKLAEEFSGEYGPVFCLSNKVASALITYMKGQLRKQEYSNVS